MVITGNQLQYIICIVEAYRTVKTWFTYAFRDFQHADKLDGEYGEDSEDHQKVVNDTSFSGELRDSLMSGFQDYAVHVTLK